MALSEDLPLYRATYRLLNLLIPLMQGFPRFFRYGLGSRMVELTLDILSLIHREAISRIYPCHGVLSVLYPIFHSPSVLRSPSKLTATFTTGRPDKANRSG